MAIRIANFALTALLAGASAAIADEPADLASPERVARGRAQFAESCSYCHGEDGAGGEGGAPMLQGRSELGAADLFETITRGRISGMNIMPAWGEALTEDQRWALVAYIRSMAGK